MSEPGHYSILVEDGPERLDAYLARKTGESRVFVQQQISRGRVTLNGVVVDKASHRVRPGDRLEARFVEDDPDIPLAPIAGKLDILHEDEHLLVLNKAQGVVVHPAAGHRGETLVHYLLHHLKGSPDFGALSTERPGIVHRLDRGTSGVLLVAKHRRAQETLSSRFKARQIRKEYEAIAWGVMKERGTFDSPIGRDPRDRKRMSSRSTEARDALTRFQRAGAFRHFTHVALFPHTGRTHQLRVHLFEAGHPIVGDDLYGRRPRQFKTPLAVPVEQALDGITQTLLHARRLELAHPVTDEPMSFEAPRPENFDRFLKLLKELDS